MCSTEFVPIPECPVDTFCESLFDFIRVCSGGRRIGIDNLDLWFGLTLLIVLLEFWALS